MTTATITPRQQSFLRSLLEERLDVLGITDLDAYIEAQGITRLTARDASVVIDKIKSFPVSRKPEWSHLPEGRTIVNRYTKDCALCGGEVEAGKGFAVAVNGTWGTYHQKGECFNEGETLADVDCGYYALPSATGNNDLDFFNVHVRNGSKEILRVIGGHADKRLPRAQARTVAEALVALGADGRRDAQALFGREIGRCGACGRHLTDETSRARGLGAECASK